MVVTPFNIESTLKLNTLPPANIFNQDLYFTSFKDAYYIAGFDAKGDIRYIYENTNERPELIRMLIEEGKIYFIYTSKGEQYIKRDLMGKEAFSKNYRARHDSTPYKNGGEMILGSSEWGLGDVIYELNADKDLIRCIDIGSVIRNAASPRDKGRLNRMIYDRYNIYVTNGKPEKVDWAHINSLVYNPDTDILYLSLRHLGILAVDATTHELLWWMADDELKAPEGTEYGEKPINSLYLKDIPSLQRYRMNTRNGPIGQSALLLRKNGNLLIFDNQVTADTNTNASRVREYRIRGRSASMVRNFTDSNNSHVRFLGDVDLTGQNHENILIFYGDGYPKRIIEINPKNEEIYNLEIATAVDAFRVDKFPLYPYRDKTKKYSIDY